MSGSKNGNGTGTPRTTPPTPAANTERVPRRVVLLQDGEDSAVERVLEEYHGAEISGRRLHQDVQRYAVLHRGRRVAAEWLGPLGWTRFLWCRK